MCFRKFEAFSIFFSYPQDQKRVDFAIFWLLASRKEENFYLQVEKVEKVDSGNPDLLAWDVNLSHTNVNLLNTKLLYRKSVRQNCISNVKVFDRLTLILFDRFSGKIFQQIYMCDRFTP